MISLIMFVVVIIILSWSVKLKKYEKIETLTLFYDKCNSFYEEIKKYHTDGSLENHPVRISEKEWESIFS